jgi:hypothetical protein
MALAKATGRPAEVSLTSETTLVIADPATGVFGGGQRAPGTGARRGGGGWRPVDLTLHARPTGRWSGRGAGRAGVLRRWWRRWPASPTAAAGWR